VCQEGWDGARRHPQPAAGVQSQQSSGAAASRSRSHSSATNTFGREGSSSMIEVVEVRALRAAFPRFGYQSQAQAQGLRRNGDGETK